MIKYLLYGYYFHFIIEPKIFGVQRFVILQIKKANKNCDGTLPYSSRIYVIITVVIMTNILISLLLIIGFKSYTGQTK